MGGTELVDSGPVLFHVEGGVGHLRLNRPATFNGLDTSFLRRFHEVVEMARGDDRVRVLLLTAEGTAFCSGLDVMVAAEREEGLPAYLCEMTMWLNASVQALMSLPVPVVAAVQGLVAGGGFGLVCAADIVLAGESATFLAEAIRLGMSPDAGTTANLTQLVGLRRAMEITMTSPLLSALAAEEIGLITRVVSDRTLRGEAVDLARTLASGPTRALAATKRLMWSGVAKPAADQIKDEALTIADVSCTDDAREALAAVVERRRPVFHGR
jgi:2-(1,2-epoxy-1,2-dihydrophenyl)acetyl-CoA isomerase